MATPGADPSALLPMVGDIVERNIDTDGVAAHRHCPADDGSHRHVGRTNGSSFTTTTTDAPVPALRPIQAVVGQAFPLVRTRRSYGRQVTSAPADPRASPTSPPLPATANRLGESRSASREVTTAYTGLSAHVQPQDGAAAYGNDGGSDEKSRRPGPRLPIPEGGSEPMLPVGGSAQQHLPAHQWSTTEFEQLRSGYYYVSAVPTTTTTTASAKDAPPSTEAAAARPTERMQAATAAPAGEDFFTLLFQCLRSTVRKHQQLALEVLLAHLQGAAARESGEPNGAASPTAAAVADQLYAEATALRERCVHGPNCGPFLFFVLEVLVSAGHPAMVELAATCLLLLLRGLPRGAGASSAQSPTDTVLESWGSVSLLTDAISELGNPAGDAPGSKDAEKADDDTSDPATHNSAQRDVEGTDAQRAAQDDAALPFSEVSELLRGPDARYGLEQLGFTNKVLATMHLLLYSDVEGGSGREGRGASETPVGADQEAGAVLESAASNPRRDRPYRTGSAQLSPRHGQVLFLELLLCGGVGIGHRTACRRVAEDPHFLSWLEEQLSSVVLGQRPLGDLMELTCVLQHLAHVPAALRSVLRGGPDGDQQRTDGVTTGAAAAAASSMNATTQQQQQQQRQRQRFHETWLLFFIYVASTAVKEVRTVRQVFAIVWSMLFLRSCVRQNPESGTESSRATADPTRVGFGLVYDMSDTLLSDGMAIGGALVLEMWFLQYSSAEHVSRSAPPAAGGSLDGYFLDAARAALQLCRKPAAAAGEETQPSAAASGEAHQREGGAKQTDDRTAVAPSYEVAAARQLLREFQWLSNAHFFATYVTQMRQRAPAVCYALCGSAVETQETMKFVVRHVVMDPTRLSGAFARFTSPLLSPLSSSAVKKSSAASAESAGCTFLSPSAAPRAQPTTAQGWAAAVQAVLHRWVSPFTSSLSPTTATSSLPLDAVDVAVTGAPVSSFSSRSIAVLLLALDAAALYANTRLAAAFADVYPAVAQDVVVGYAVLLTQAYETACLRLRDGATLRLQVDELCTMAEAVQLLQRCSQRGVARQAAPAPSAMGITESTHGSKTKDTEPHGKPQYDREARIGGFFLLHSIAISKHCLDVVPLILPLLQFRLDAAPVTAAAATVDATLLEAQLSLLASLQAGIELTPVPFMMGSGSSAAAVSVTGAPRSWVVYPLYDSTFAAKHAWAHWLRALLGLHRLAKDVVGWDAVLSHTVLWVLTHRRALWSPTLEGTKTGIQKTFLDDDRRTESDTESEEDAVEVSSGSAEALCALMVDLCTVLHSQCAPSSSGAPQGSSSTTNAGMSAAASRTLEVSLAAYSDVPSEDGLPLVVHAVLAYIAAHSSARTALAALQVLLATPILPVSTLADAANTDAAQLAGHIPLASGPHTISAFPAFSYAAATAQVCAWLQAWSIAQGQQAQSATSVYWSLDDVVALVQLAGPHLRCSMGSGGGGGEGWVLENEGCLSRDPARTDGVWDTEELWCVRCLTDGLLRYYLQQRTATSGALSAMEKAVLCATLEELEWFPAVLWPHVGL